MYMFEPHNYRGHELVLATHNADLHGLQAKCIK